MGTFRMPSLGADMEAGTLVEWLKHAGDKVKRGDVVAVVETEKGAIEVEIFEDGTIDRLLVAEGAKVPVGTPLATLAGGAEEPEIAGRAPPARAAPVLQATIVPPSVVGRASPAARRRAQQLGVDLAHVTGTGPSGAIQRIDVERDAKASKGGAAPDLAQMRHAIAAAMARSKREIPHYYLSHSIDLWEAQAFVEEFNAARPPEERLLIGVLLVKVAALALRDFPELNGFYLPEGRRPSEAIHVGVAIAMRGGGLAAPAIHDTDRLALPSLMAQMRDLVARVRRGGFRSSELADPTATVSSLGDRGVEALLPVIYPPQVAIVGFGAPQTRPWVVEGKVVPRPVVTVTLAADHRVSDGHRGALFLRRIEALLQEPRSL